MKVTKSIQKQFLEILEKKKIHPVYQPIVSLEDGSIYGYEALSRIDLPDCAFTTEEMFRIAEKLNCVWELESICRKQSIKNAKSKPKDAKLFVNVDPKVIHDGKFRSGLTAGYLKKYGIDPDDIVFEITERSSIEEPKTFKKSIEHYTKQNYKIAIDDYGSEYAGPNRLCLLKPDIIKIDMEIIRDINTDMFKRSFVKSLSIFGKSTGVKILAEGIETPEELSTLIDLGVDYGQGFYLGRPVTVFSQMNYDIAEEIRLRNNSPRDIPGSAVFQYIKQHGNNAVLSINDESGNLIEELKGSDIKELAGITEEMLQERF